jgi:hypothetical protein
MNTLNAALQHQEPAIARAVVYRTRGHAHGPVTRLMSPSDLGEILKPFVFLDRIDIAEPSSRKVESFGLHPHSGIATLTWLFEGYANYEDNMGRRGKLTQRSMEWMHAEAHGMAAASGTLTDFAASNFGLLCRPRQNWALHTAPTLARNSCPRTAR